MIPTLLVAFTTADPFVAIIGVLILYIAVQQVENAVLVPKIQGEAVELHPSVVIFSLIVGGAIAGLPGAIFSIPVTAAARNVYRYLFRRLSEDDPAVPPADIPDMSQITAGDGDVDVAPQLEGDPVEVVPPDDEARPRPGAPDGPAPQPDGPAPRP